MPYRLTIDPGSDTPQLDAWRTTARALLLARIAPDEIELIDATTPQSLALGFATEPDLAPRADAAKPSVPKAFLDLAESVACHATPDRWQLLYRTLWRLQSNRDLLQHELDPDIAQLRRLADQVRRDLHKMHAFVRFRLVETPGVTPAPLAAASPAATKAPRVPEQPSGSLFDAAPQSSTASSAAIPLALMGSAESQVTATQLLDAAADHTLGSSEHYIAWYRPDHRILALAAPFFAERFSVMQWTILTHYASVSWSPETKQLTWAPGVPRSEAPPADELDTLWRSYYASIFNPARLNPRAMRAEMPTRYWANLPELDILPQLLQQAAPRVQTMMADQSTDTAAPFIPADHTLPALAAALPTCKGCELYQHATQAVFGQGPARARLLLIGEQPGDEEDRRGTPFVGPAGRVFDQALADLGLDRAELYVTNAVKHFKFIERGKRRIHESPKLRELTACKPWLLAELDAVRPNVVICLGASAAKSLLGAKFALMKDRGKVIPSPYFDKVIATLHPSAILRAQDEATSQTLFNFMKQDIALAHQLATAT